jgi:hypothetical protein
LENVPWLSGILFAFWAMYEVHLTVAAIATSAWQAFEQRVTSLGGKAMVIELARGDTPAAANADPWEGWQAR